MPNKYVWQAGDIEWEDDEPTTKTIELAAGLAVLKEETGHVPPRFRAPRDPKNRFRKRTGRPGVHGGFAPGEIDDEEDGSEDLPKALAPGSFTTEFPGWKHDRALSVHYARQLAAPVVLVNAEGIAADWLTANKDDKSAPSGGDPKPWIAQRVAAWTAALYRNLTDLWKEGWFLGARSARSVVARSGPVDWGSWSPGNPAAARVVRTADDLNRWLRSYGVASIRSIEDNRMEELAARLHLSLAEGWSGDQLAREIEDILTNPRRARMIANTETARAVSQGTLSEYRHAGVERVMWVTADDARVCPPCDTNEAMGAVPMGSMFSGSMTDAPPGHPNCRCAVIAVPDGMEIPVRAPAVTKAGPKGYIHGWIKVGADDVHVKETTIDSVHAVHDKAGTRIGHTFHEKGKFRAERDGKSKTFNTQHEAIRYLSDKHHGRRTAKPKTGPTQAPKTPTRTGTGHHGIWASKPEPDAQFDYAHFHRESNEEYASSGGFSKHTFSVGDLTPTQAADNEEGDIGGASGTGDPLVVPVDGKLYLLDGHHRAERAASGSGQITAWVPNSMVTKGFNPDLHPRGPGGKFKATTLGTREFSEKHPPENWIYRGVGSSAGAAATRSGALGSGDYGKGQYFSSEIGHAQSAAGRSKEGRILRAAIKPGARIKSPPQKVRGGGSSAIDQWAEKNNVDVVDLINYRLVRNPSVLDLDERDYTPNESAALYNVAQGYSHDDDVLQQHGALIDELEGRTTKFSPGKVYDTLSDHYPDKVLDWVKDAAWSDPTEIKLKHIDMARRPGGRDMSKVRSMAREIKAGKQMKPIYLVDTPSAPPLVIADGYHRALAHQHAGKQTILAYVASVDEEHGPWDRAMHDAKLNKVGPKGYIHGWIFVGAPGAGSRVFHPQHGHGTVAEHRGDSVAVHFDSGHKADFAAGQGSGPPRLEPTKKGKIEQLFDDSTSYEERDTLAAEIFKGQFGDFRTEVTGTTRTSFNRWQDMRSGRKTEVVVVHGKLFNGRSPAPAGRFTRAFYRDPDDGKMVVLHEELKVNHKLQGQGFASAFNAHAEKAYREEGIDRIELQANIDVGGYAWARKGFDWYTFESAAGIADRVEKQARKSRNKEAQAEVAALIKRMETNEFGSAGYPTPYEFSQVGFGSASDGSWVGKEAMLKSNWMGVKHL